MNDGGMFTRRDFAKIAGLGMAGSLFAPVANATKIQGFDDKAESKLEKAWSPISDRKIKVGLVGHGVCKFSMAFGFQHHPNVEVVAVSDLIPERCKALAKEVKCPKTYPSLEKMIEDDSIEALFICTDAPSHARHCIDALKRGKHVACAVPAVFGSMDDAYALYETVKQTGKTYMMFETSMFRKNCFEMRKIYEAGKFGKVMYTEGEYWHYSGGRHYVDSYKKWRDGLPPMWYPTHNDAYFVGVTNGSFLEVNGFGVRGEKDNSNNRYSNPFKTEIALYKTSLGGIARMVRSGDTIGRGYGDETGRMRGTKGAYYDRFEGDKKNMPDLSFPAIPPSMKNQFYQTWHGGSHPYLTNEFVLSILQNRKPLVDVAMSLNMTVGGIAAHASAMRDNETIKIPQFKYWA